MSDTDTNLNITRFGLVALAIYVLLPLLALAVDAAFGIDIRNAGFTIIPPMIAGLVEGQAFGRRTGRGPTSGERLRATGLGLLVLIGVNMVLAGFLAIAAPPVAEALFAFLRGGWGMAVIALTLLLSALAIWFFFGLGAGNVVKSGARPPRG